jgi:hypothetical protein
MRPSSPVSRIPLVTAHLLTLWSPAHAQKKADLRALIGGARTALAIPSASHHQPKPKWPTLRPLKLRPRTQQMMDAARARLSQLTSRVRDRDLRTSGLRGLDGFQRVWTAVRMGTRGRGR